MIRDWCCKRKVSPNKSLLLSRRPKYCLVSRSRSGEERSGRKTFLRSREQVCNKQIAENIGEKFLQFRDRLPTEEALKTGDFPATGMPGFDNSRSVKVLRIIYRSLSEGIVDTVKSLQAVEEI